MNQKLKVKPGQKPTPKQKLLARQQAARRAARTMPPEQQIGDLRDDVMAVVLNTFGRDFKRSHEKGGPVAGTLLAWDRKQVQRPQLNTVRGALRSCGYDLFILPESTAYIRPSSALSPKGK